MEFDLERAFLTFDAVTIDDDMNGNSQGDGDGTIDFAETIELTVALLNIGHVAASGLTAELVTDSPHVNMLNGTASFGDIPAGEVGSHLEPLVFEIAADVPDGSQLGFRLQFAEDPGTIPLVFDAHAPAYLVGALSLDDTAGGDGNGIADPGETVQLTLGVQNVGRCDTPDLQAALGTFSGFFTPDGAVQSVGILQPGEDVPVGTFTVEIAPECPETYADYLELGLSAGEGYALALPIAFCTGEVLSDQIERHAAGWYPAARPGAWADEWHPETLRNHTPNGAMSWKCGGEGEEHYVNLLYAILETAEFHLPGACMLSFWHWMDAETSSYYPDYCYDGGLLEITTDAGATWTQLTPQEGGYSHLIREGSVPGPFAPETPVWSGSESWQEVTVDLTSLVGPVQLRWAFGSDGAITQEGWYIDDVRIYKSQVAGADDAAANRVLRPRLHPARPNPLVVASRGSFAATSVSFELPYATDALVTLHDASGRLVRTLASARLPEGPHVVHWDGRDVAGRVVPAGSYYINLRVGETAATRKLTVLR